MNDDEKKKREIEAIREKAEKRVRDEAANKVAVDEARNGYLKAVRALCSELSDLADQTGLRWTQGADAYMDDAEGAGRFMAPSEFTLHGLKGKVVLRPGRFVRTMMPSGAFGGLRAITNGHGADICYHVKSDRLIYPNGNPVDALDLVKNVT
jgi:hypothetical protein